ncbi:hypothetical protein D9601_08615 [Sphingomonas sp. MA1305]|uniref:hypothetical protein n=1 Tax=Sphingomonas sp. MA1305 TaxID=2479204 RepID=UPI0018E001FC|nr:hypothetical protein [Sphingomonas sp. MA1305]MBI0475410.1 hypothetical protein [Sphingomonas sp. MA1305]
MRPWRLGATLVAMAVSCPCAAQSAREILTQASFADRDPDDALKKVVQAQALTAAQLRRDPGDREALLMQATALGYRAKLTGSRTDAVGARHAFEALVARDPRNAEAQLGFGAWHMGAIAKVGRMVGRALLGAQKPVAFAALDRAVALGGDRALFPGLAALLRLQADPADPRGRQLAEVAARAGVVTPLDRLMQRGAVAILASLRSDDPAATRKLASQLLPLGRLPDR